MIHLRLIRFSKTPYSTWGVFVNGLTNKPICLSLEKPWKNNKPFESCIPLGIYKLVKYRKPRQFQLLNVPNRTYILIHIANWIKQLKGCIAPGSEFSPKGVLNSSKAMSKIEALFEDYCDIDEKSFQYINLKIEGI